MSGLWQKVRRRVVPFCGVFLLAGGVCPGATPRNVAGTPEHRIPLEKLGYRAVNSTIIVREGYTMSTVDLIDDEHVLVTFSARKLIPRMPDDVEGDQDRLIKAVVLHLPDGRVVHETEWRTHDRSQYLWSLGRDRFLLRLRNTLYRVEPMRGFERASLLESKRPIEVIEVSPAHDMLLVETSAEHHIGDDPTVPSEDTKIVGTFYDVLEGATPTLHIRAVVTEDKPFLTAFTSRGFLATVKEDREHWGFDFHPFGGEKMELAGFTSTCQPHAEFLTDATFLATGCRGGDDRRLLAGFDLAAQANWVFTVDNAPVWPAMVTAPGSGRFALRTTVTSNGAQETDHLSPEEVTEQQIRVYRFHDGVEMLRTKTAPVQRPGQNFSLSPDGHRLAILRDNDLELYRLPTQSAEEVKHEKREDEVVGRIVYKPGQPIETAPEKRAHP